METVINGSNSKKLFIQCQNKCSNEKKLAKLKNRSAQFKGRTVQLKKTHVQFKRRSILFQTVRKTNIKTKMFTTIISLWIILLLIRNQ